VCKVWSEAFYSTFDQTPTNKQFTFTGTCRYCLAQASGFDQLDSRWFLLNIDHKVQEAVGDAPRLVMRSASVILGGEESVLIEFEYDGRILVTQKRIFAAV